MNQFKRKLSCFCMMAAAIFCLAGCGAHTYMTYTYTVDTGDSVTIKFETTDHYEITSDLPFEISKDGELLSQGTFIMADGYQMYVDVVENDANATVIESGSTDTCDYLMWNFNNSEFNYAILIKNSNTGILLGNQVSEESAKEVFGRLEISLQ
ncbi:MAG: hypothetical protein NC409_06270 [Clostridium sp.]|nr:hypothetical protein [Clostridium sp.]